MKQSNKIFLFLLAFLLVIPCVSGISTDGLKAYYNFNSSKNLTDYNNLNNLTLTGTSPVHISTPIDMGYNVTGSLNPASGLTASDSASLSITGNMTIGGIFYIRNLPTSSTSHIVSKYYTGSGTSLSRSFYLGLDSTSGSCPGNITFLVSSTTGSFTGNSTCSNTTPSFNQWHSIVAVYEAGVSQKVYLDGVLIGFTNGSVPASIADGTGKLGITNAGNNNLTLPGSVEEAFIFNRTWSEAEVLQYEQNKIGSTGLLTDYSSNVSISNVSVINVNNQSVIINWNTNIATNVSLNYGASSSLGTIVTNTTYSTSHSQTLNGLNSSTIYYYNITSYNSSSLFNTSGVNNFTTNTTRQFVYYYNSSGGDDSNNCSTIALACKTITDLNTKSLIAGDTVYFACGEIWHLGESSFPDVYSGNSSANVTYSSYGDCSSSNKRPKIWGGINASSVSNWSSVDSNIWSTNFTNTIEMGLIVFNMSGNKISGNITREYANLNTQGEFFYNESTDKVYVYSVSNPATFYDGIEIGLEDTVFDINSKSYVDFVGLEIGYNAKHGVEGQNLHHIYVRNNTFVFIGGAYQNSYPSTTRYGNAMQHFGDSHDTLTEYNYFEMIYDASLTQQQSNSADANIYNHIMRYNIVNSSRYGYELFNSNTTSTNHNISIYHNTFYNLGVSHNPASGSSTGFNRFARITAEATNISFYDNIVYNSSYLAWELGANSAYNWKGTILFYNNLYYKNPSASSLMDYNNTHYASLSAFRIAQPTQDNNSIELTSTSTLFQPNTFSPYEESPACNNASDGGDIGALSCVPPIIDVNPPNITANSPLNVIITDNYTLFNCSGTDDINLTNISLYINGELNQTNTSFGNRTVTWTLNNLENGNYTWFCNGIDNNSNTANSSIYWLYIDYDNVSPIVMINSPINVTLETYYINFNWTVTDNVNLTNTTLFLDGVAYYTDYNPINGTNNYTADLSNGVYYWLIQACDSNICINSSLNWVERNYDDSSPVVSAVSPVNVTIGDNYVLFVCNASDNVNLSNVSLYINSVLNQTNNTNGVNGISSWNLTNLTNGNYSWSCTAKDSNGNIQSTGNQWVNIYYTINLSIDKVLEKVTNNSILIWNSTLYNLSGRIFNTTYVVDASSNSTTTLGSYVLTKSKTFNDTFTSSTNSINITISNSASNNCEFYTKVTLVNGSVLTSNTISITTFTAPTSREFTISNLIGNRIRNIETYAQLSSDAGQSCTTGPIISHINEGFFYDNKESINNTNPSININTSRPFTLYTVSNGYYANYTNLSVSTENLKINITDLYNSTLNIYVLNYTNGNVSDFSGWVYNLLHHSNISFSTTSGVASVGLVTGLSYLVYVESGSQAISDETNYKTVSLVNVSQDTVFVLNPYNSIFVTIKDEITGNNILSNCTLILSGNESSSLSVNNTYNYTNLTAGTYSITISNAGYQTRIYDVTVTSGSTQRLTVYLLNTTYSASYVTFTLLDSNTGGTLSNTSIIMSRLINNTWMPVETKTSDISGRAQLNFQPLIKYQFALSKDNYDSQIFYLNPIIFSSYNLRLDPRITLGLGEELQDVTITYGSTDFSSDTQNNFIFSITSAQGSLNSYNMSLVYPGGSQVLTGSNALGETFVYNFNISNLSLGQFDKVNLTYCFLSTLGPLHCYNYSYDISGISESGSWKDNSGNTYGLGLIERLIIVTICVILVAGFFTLFIGPLAGAVIGLFLFGFFTATGFVPLWAILPSLLVGFFILSRRSSQ